jgi:hypothetical protein
MEVLAAREHKEADNVLGSIVTETQQAVENPDPAPAFSCASSSAEFRSNLKRQRQGEQEEGTEEPHHAGLRSLQCIMHSVT